MSYDRNSLMVSAGWGTSQVFPGCFYRLCRKVVTCTLYPKANSTCIHREIKLSDNGPGEDFYAFSTLCHFASLVIFSVSCKTPPFYFLVFIPLPPWRVGFKHFVTCCYIHSAAHISWLKGILSFVFSLA